MLKVKLSEALLYVGKENSSKISIRVVMDFLKVSPFVIVNPRGLNVEATFVLDSLSEFIKRWCYALLTLLQSETQSFDIAI